MQHVRKRSIVKTYSWFAGETMAEQGDGTLACDFQATLTCPFSFICHNEKGNNDKSN